MCSEWWCGGWGGWVGGFLAVRPKEQAKSEAGCAVHIRCGVLEGESGKGSFWKVPEQSGV